MSKLPTSFASREEFAALTPGPGFVKLTPRPYRNLPEGIHTGGPWLSPDGQTVWKLAYGGCWVNSAIEIGPTDEAACMRACAGEPGFLPARAWYTTWGENGWPWIVKPFMRVVEEGEKIERKTALTIERGIRALNELGWVLNDTLRIAFFEGKPAILDLSTARPWNKPALWGYYNDQSYVNSMFRRHGQDRLADLREAASSIWFDTPLLERADASAGLTHVYATDCIDCDLPPGVEFILAREGKPCKGWVLSPSPIEDEFVFKYELEWVTAPMVDRRPPTKGQYDV